MTTESKQGLRSRSGFTLLGAAISSSALGLVSVAVAAIVADRSAVYGALVGMALCVTVFGFGAFVVDAVAGLMPSAALLMALLTYTLQVAIMALAFLALTRSGALDDTIDRRWLGGTVIACTMAWLAAQTWFATRLRIPAFDLPADGPEAGAR